MSRSGKRWSNEEEAKALELAKAKAPIAEIAKDLERSEDAVVFKLINVCLKMAKENKQKLSHEEIAETINVPLETIKRHVDDKMKFHFNPIDDDEQSDDELSDDEEYEFEPDESDDDDMEQSDAEAQSDAEDDAEQSDDEEKTPPRKSRGVPDASTKSKSIQDGIDRIAKSLEGVESLLARFVESTEESEKQRSGEIKAIFQPIMQNVLKMVEMACQSNPEPTVSRNLNLTFSSENVGGL
jgi:hypothetical protein